MLVWQVTTELTTNWMAAGHLFVWVQNVAVSSAKTCIAGRVEFCGTLNLEHSLTQQKQSGYTVVVVHLYYTLLQSEVFRLCTTGPQHCTTAAMHCWSAACRQQWGNSVWVLLAAVWEPAGSSSLVTFRISTFPSAFVCTKIVKNFYNFFLKIFFISNLIQIHNLMQIRN